MPIFSNSCQSFLDTYCTDKLYELTCISTHAKDNQNFLKLNEKCIPIKKNIAKLIGFWNTEIGCLNTTVQLWEYDSYSEKANSNSKLEKDSNWNSAFLEKMFPMIVEEENMTLRKISSGPLMVSGCMDGACYYRMNIYNIKSPILENVVKFKELTAKFYKALEDANVKSIRQVAVFLPDSDKMSKMIEFVRQCDMDDQQLYNKRKELSSIRDQIHEVSNLIESEVLVPTSFSPLK